MSYMPFNSDEQPLYADEHENILFLIHSILLSYKKPNQSMHCPETLKMR